MQYNEIGRGEVGSLNCEVRHGIKCIVCVIIVHVYRSGDSEKEYIDLSIQKIVMTIGIVARMTDLELDGVDENGSSGSVVNYDKIHLMGLMGYLNIYYGEEIAEFDDFINNENEAIRAFMKAGQPVLINEGKKDKKEEGNEPV